MGQPSLCQQSVCWAAWWSKVDVSKNNILLSVYFPSNNLCQCTLYNLHFLSIGPIWQYTNVSATTLQFAHGGWLCFRSAQCILIISQKCQHPVGKMLAYPFYPSLSSSYSLLSPLYPVTTLFLSHLSLFIPKTLQLSC